MKFDSEAVYNEAKMKSYNGKLNTNFYIIKYQKKVLSVFVYQ